MIDVHWPDSSLMFGLKMISTQRWPVRWHANITVLISCWRPEPKWIKPMDTPSYPKPTWRELGGKIHPVLPWVAKQLIYGSVENVYFQTHLFLALDWNRRKQRNTLFLIRLNTFGMSFLYSAPITTTIKTYPLGSFVFVITSIDALLRNLNWNIHCLKKIFRFERISLPEILVPSYHLQDEILWI